jgi:hypothetical protein
MHIFITDNEVVSVSGIGNYMIGGVQFRYVLSALPDGIEWLCANKIRSGFLQA